MDELKQQVQEFWDQESCGTWAASSSKFSREYFEEIESFRYRIEPEIFSFAQFTRAHGKRVLEVGIGAGSDFLQWVRAGADAVGIDLTNEALDNVRHRLDVYGLQAELKQSDAENLPFPDNSFDLAYSWGVIHHTPNTERALDEIIRVLRPGGIGKIMVYNRHSPRALRHWISGSMARRRPYPTISAAIWNHVESIGTKSYTPREIESWLAARPVKDVRIASTPGHWDRVNPEDSLRDRVVMRTAVVLSKLLGWSRNGWFLQIEFVKR